MMKKTDFLIVILFTILGLGLHAYLTWEHYKIYFSAGDGPGALCQAGAYFDCAAVAASQYSQFLGVPLSIWGFWTNFIFLIAIVWLQLKSAYLEQEAPVARQVVALISILLLGSAVTMGLISTWLIKKACLYCMGTYVTSSVQFLLVFKFLKTLKPMEGRLLMKGVFTLIAIPALSFFSKQLIDKSIGVGGLGYYIAESLNDWKNNPSQEFDLNLGITIPPDSEPSTQWTIVEFVDLFCPHCKHASYPLKAFVQSRPQVKLVVKLFPLDGMCNPAIEHSSGNSLRCQWSWFLWCAHEQGYGNKVLAWIFEHQAELANLSFQEGRKNIVQELGLPDTTLSACENSEDVKNKIKQMAEEGKKAQVKGTPSIFLQGKLLPRGQLIPVLEKAMSN